MRSTVPIKDIQMVTAVLDKGSKLSGWQRRKEKIRKWIKQNHRGGGQHRILRVCLQPAGTGGFRTVQAFHLSTAKKLLQQATDGDIVVSDLRLPDGDGIDLLRWMRKKA